LQKKIGWISDLICFAILIAILMFSNEPNEHHKWIKKRDWPAVYGVVLHPERDDDLLGRKYKERDEHGRLPHH